MSVSKHKPIHIKLTFNQNQFSQTQLYQNQLSLLPNQTHTNISFCKSVFVSVLDYEPVWIGL